MKRVIILFAVCVVVAVLSWCSEPRTEVIVVVDSDLDVPGELSSVVVQATSPSGEQSEATGVLATAADLPTTVGLVHTDGPLGPFSVRAVGMNGDAEVVERNARFSFVEHQTLTLVMHLARSCVGEDCGADMTCSEAGCRSIDVDRDELAVWTGTPPRLEGSQTDADADIDADSDGDGDGDGDTDADSDTDVDADGDGDTDADTDSDVDGDGDADADTSCTGDDVSWDGSCYSRDALSNCRQSCNHPSCTSFDEFVCIDLGGADYRCLGHDGTAPWEPCGAGW